MLNCRIACFLALTFASPAWGQTVLTPAPPAPQSLAAARQHYGSEPGTAGVSLVLVDVKALKRAARDRNLKFVLSASRAASFRTHEVQPLEDGRFAWSGESDGKAKIPPGTATIVVDGSDVTGSIATQDGRLYQLRPAGAGLTALLEIDPGKLPPIDSPRSGKSAKPPTPLPRDVRGGDTPVIKILFAYTDAAAKASGNINNMIDLALVQSNQAFITSHIDARFSVVERMQIKVWNERTTTYGGLVSQFATMREVQERRQASHADVGVLLVDNMHECGLAYEIFAAPWQAYAVVGQHCATIEYSVAHEIGHLAGARHDMAEDPEITPFTFGHGYQSPWPWGWRTIMAYPCNYHRCDTVLPYWSNPEVSHLGVPTGTLSFEDVAHVWRIRAREMADYGNSMQWERVNSDDVTSNISCVGLGAQRITCFSATDDERMQQVEWMGQGSSERVLWSKDQAVTSAPDCLTNVPGRIDCFFAGKAHALVHGTITASGIVFENLGDEIVGPPSCVSAGAKQIDCFVRHTDDTVHHIAWRDDHRDRWDALGGRKITSDLSCTVRAANPFDCFARGTDGAMWQLSWNGWSAGWHSRGGGITSRPECLSWAPGRVDCFARGAKIHMFHIAAVSNKWAEWDDRGGELVSDISCVSRMESRLDCFVVGTLPGVHHLSWDGRGWAWQGIGATPTIAPECLSVTSGSVDCFVRDFWSSSAKKIMVHRRLLISP